ncbi:MAG TPA: ketopantoate reductase family protein [Blastocatellia bacterium]|nr:ketopantoate reductase family protein [Blastocatellia bacterium]
MSNEKQTRYVIFGAGAIGIPVAGLLRQSGSRVVCVARPAYREALERGVTIRQDGEEMIVKLDAVTSARELEPESGDVLIITTKSQATGEAVASLAEVYPNRAPVVCLQNGVYNEEIAARHFKNVYAGLVFLSATQMEPSLITLPKGRTIAIGCYPRGVDDLAEHTALDLSRAGLDATASAYVMAMKWSKLILNLNNATFAIINSWVEHGMADPETRSLMFGVRDEGLRVLDRAGIEVEPPPDEPSPIRARELTEKLKQPARSDAGASLPEDQRTYSSMWQDLQLGRVTGEADHLNGVIVELGRKVGVPTPYNSTLLEIVNRMFDEGLKPGIHTPAELHALIWSRKATDSQH